eukprot:CAMPEP_0184868932 /NCGR_PEP_ID=MMETSP0580-20130426/32256_1 /TAXON_ID=1118495 /ORGANISM="Dactyliosolen fragilissimus" /LENGTH=761 /DNA_ID=CAMNT_0027370109 /DNA_START=523 /DNA_END=2804 /DNA_ORIENTATION=+
MTLTESMRYFVAYVIRHNKEKKIKRYLSSKRRHHRSPLPKLLHSIRTNLKGTKTSHGKEEEKDKKRIELYLNDLRRKDEGLMIKLQEEVEREDSEKKSIKETLRDLNESRKELIRLVGYDAKLLVPSFSYLILGALMTSVIPHFYSMCITCLATAKTCTKDQVLKALFGLAASSLLGALFTGARGSLFWLAGSRGNYNVRVKLHRNLLLQEAAFFDGTETGVLLSRLNNDVNKIGMVISFHVNVVLRQFAQFVFGSVYLVKISPQLAATSFAGIGLVALVSFIYGDFTRTLSERVQDKFASATAVAETSFTMSETVRAFNGVPFETTKYESSQADALNLEEVQAWSYGSHKFVSDTLQAALQGMLLYMCWCFGKAGKLDLAKLTTFMFYVNFVLESSNEVGDQWAKIQSAIGASTNVFDLIRRIPAIRDPQPVCDETKTPNENNKIIAATTTTDNQKIGNVNNATIQHQEKSGANISANSISTSNSNISQQPLIEMSNMKVTYGTMESPALKDINLNIYPGDRVAIVGRSGSGKSSMLRTIQRFYDPSAGQCKIEGISLKDMSRKEIASKIAVVEQEPSLFPLTLIENVLYGVDKDSVDDTSGVAVYSQKRRDQVSVALELAGLPVNGKMKNDLGLELDTRVGEGGRTLSGGQRQRVAIARALIRRPDVLLLDEPTAALDSKSEKTVVEALKNAMKNTKSMVMVTHRLGVIRSLDVNKVVILERGTIVEVGDPEELLRRGGLYAQLALEQGIRAESIHLNG